MPERKHCISMKSCTMKQYTRPLHPISNKFQRAIRGQKKLIYKSTHSFLITHTNKTKQIAMPALHTIKINRSHIHIPLTPRQDQTSLRLKNRMHRQFYADCWPLGLDLCLSLLPFYLLHRRCQQTHPLG